MIGIYLIINTVNGKVYVGSSLNIEQRWHVHVSLLNKNLHKNAYLQNAWNKYGSNSFHFCIVEECAIDDLVLIEQLWIDASEYKSYNLSEIADRYKVSETAKAKISLALRGRKHSEKTKAKMRLNYNRNVVRKSNNYWLGKKHTESTKRKISESLRQKALDKNLNLQSYAFNPLFVGS